MSSSLTPSKGSPLRRHSWDALNETQAMLEGSPSDIRLSPSSPIFASSPSSSSSSSPTPIPTEHESLDDILSKARRSTSATTINSSKSSPLNPKHTPRRPSSSHISHRASFTNVLRIPSEESRALSMHIPSASSTRPSTPSSLSLSAIPSLSQSANSTLRGSMILYRLAADELRPPSVSSTLEHDRLIPPNRFRNSRYGGNRDSMLSMSGMSISADSFVSLSSDSKYPISGTGSERGLIPYAYEPDEVDDSLLDDENDGEDWSFEDEYNEARWREKKRLSGSTDPASSNAAHTPTLPNGHSQSHLNRRIRYSSRGVVNLFGLLVLLAGLLALFIIYPVVSFYHDNGRNHRITTNSRINSTGQAEGNDGEVAPTDNNRENHGVFGIMDRRANTEVEVLPQADDHRSPSFRFIPTGSGSSSTPENDVNRRISTRFTRQLRHD